MHSPAPRTLSAAVARNPSPGGKGRKATARGLFYFTLARLILFAWRIVK